MGLVKRVIWLFIVAMIVLAVVKGVPSEMSQWGEWAKTQTDDMASGFMDWLKSIDLSQYFHWDLGQYDPKSVMESASAAKK